MFSLSTTTGCLSLSVYSSMRADRVVPCFLHDTAVRRVPPLGLDHPQCLPLRQVSKEPCMLVRSFYEQLYTKRSLFNDREIISVLPPATAKILTNEIYGDGQDSNFGCLIPAFHHAVTTTVPRQCGTERFSIGSPDRSRLNPSPRRPDPECSAVQGPVARCNQRHLYEPGQRNMVLPVICYGGAF